MYRHSMVVERVLSSVQSFQHVEAQPSTVACIFTPFKRMDFEICVLGDRRLGYQKEHVTLYMHVMAYHVLFQIKKWTVCYQIQLECISNPLIYQSIYRLSQLLFFF